MLLAQPLIQDQLSCSFPCMWFSIRFVLLCSISGMIESSEEDICIFLRFLKTLANSNIQILASRYEMPEKI